MGWADHGLALPFKCPICGSPKFDRVLVPRENGMNYVTPFHKFAGCSVMCTDREAFAAKGAMFGIPPSEGLR
ncbi:MAG: hypothetical protein JNM79_22125 [Burkholderiales bacterium]|nr:hypothetical protein [Burkholderiales bacterium]